METQTKMSVIVEKAMKYAIECHSSTNHKYGEGLEYSFHLGMVYSFGVKFIHLIPEEHRDNVLASLWVHDVIEDCRQTYNDVKEALNERIAELAYALTNEKGKNRKERGNDKYYQGIRDTEFAVFDKLCDRMANMTYSKNEGSRMFDMYVKENGGFIDKLSDENSVALYGEMFDHLKEIAQVK